MFSKTRMTNPKSLNHTGAVYCDECQSVSLCTHISGNTHPCFRKFSVRVVRDRGSVLLRRGVLFISGFAYDVVFRIAGPIAARRIAAASLQRCAHADAPAA